MPACSKTADPTADLARCFLRLANLPNALDRLSRYEATLWRQAGQSCLRSSPLIFIGVRKSSRRISPGAQAATDGRQAMFEKSTSRLSSRHTMMPSWRCQPISKLSTKTKSHVRLPAERHIPGNLTAEAKMNILARKLAK